MYLHIISIISIENVKHKYTICLHGGWENVECVKQFQ